MKFTDFITSLAEKLSEPLGALGFEKSADDLFVRFNDSHEINVVYIQKHSSEPTVCVNVGVHYDFLPKIGTTELASNKQIELPDCEVKLRLTTDLSQKDHWWPIASESINEIVDLIVGRVGEFFSRYSIDGDLSSILPEDLNEDMPDIFASLTKVRASLILARIHEVRGDFEKAASFAKYGIKAAGMAVGPKKMLKEVLKRVEQK
jgi:methyl-accepting chemotaxis protein|tara:strand:+ start:381 stop:995 length:615 start_codon:yes stop_codon:yes gene_type:complete